MTDESSEKKVQEYGKFLDPSVWSEKFSNTMEQFIATASIQEAYGEPVEVGDQVIIPTAEVLCGLGFGLGSGGGVNLPDEDDEEAAAERQTGANVPSMGGGSGAGGGGRTLSRPVAVIVATPQSVRVEPVVDITKVAIAALTAVGFMIGMYFNMRSSKKMAASLKEQARSMRG